MQNFDELDLPRRLWPERLAPLRGKVDLTRGPFDIETFRDQPYDPKLRD